MSGGQPRSGPTALALFLIALLLRLPGLPHGLPTRGHPASYRPDEHNTVRALANMKPRELDFNPRYFHNPTLYYQLCGGAALIARASGWLPQLAAETVHGEALGLARFYRIGRMLSILFGALTASILYLALLVPLGATAAGAAALLVALAPAHVVLSAAMEQEALLGLLATLALWAALAATRSGSLRLAWAGGLVAGLATATKYNGVVALLPLLLGIGLGPGPRLRRAAAALVASAVAFVLAVPYALLDWPGFQDGITFVLAERAGARWRALGHSPWFPLTHSWPWLAGEAALALAALGTLLGLGRLPRITLPAAALVLAVLIPMAWTGTDYVRYAVPALPGIALLASLPAAVLPSPLLRRAALAAIVVALANQALRTRALLSLLLGEDPREQASTWLETRYPRNARILVPREPYYGSPPRLFTDYFYRGRSRAWRDPAGFFEVVSADWDPGALEDPGVRAVVVSENEWLYPATATTPTGRFLTALFAGSFREVARFERPALLAPGLPLEAPLPPAGTPYAPAAALALAGRRLPHDLKYLNPTVVVLEPQPREP